MSRKYARMPALRVHSNANCSKRVHKTLITRLDSRKTKRFPVRVPRIPRSTRKVMLGTSSLKRGRKYSTLSTRPAKITPKRLIIWRNSETSAVLCGGHRFGLGEEYDRVGETNTDYANEKSFPYDFVHGDTKGKERRKGLGSRHNATASARSRLCQGSRLQLTAQHGSSGQGKVCRSTSGKEPFLYTRRINGSSTS